jgi:phosphatidylglycerophosphate synthase
VTVALWLLAIQGIIGGFDTAYYHEWRARLPALGAHAAPELKLHAARDFLYAVIFATLPWVAWHGSWALVLAVVLGAEIILTLRDFVVEIKVRKIVGDVYGGERVTHAVMGIIYGSMLAFLLPTIAQWSRQPTAIVTAPADVQPFLRWALTLMAAGVFASGLRDLYAAYELPHGHWPWPRRGNVKV